MVVCADPSVGARLASVPQAPPGAPLAPAREASPQGRLRTEVVRDSRDASPAVKRTKREPPIIRVKYPSLLTPLIQVRYIRDDRRVLPHESPPWGPKRSPPYTSFPEIPGESTALNRVRKSQKPRGNLGNTPSPVTSLKWIRKSGAIVVSPARKSAQILP